MKRGKGESLHWSWRRFVHVLLAAVLLCLVSISFELSKLLKSSYSGEDASEESIPSVDRGSVQEEVSLDNESGSSWKTTDETKTGEFVSSRIVEAGLRTHLEEVANSRIAENHSTDAPNRPQLHSLISRQRWKHTTSIEKPWEFSSHRNPVRKYNANSSDFPSLQTLSEIAWAAGANKWRSIQNGSMRTNTNHASSSEVKSCPSSLSKSKEEMEASKKVVVLPCGLMLGSAITVVGKPRPARLKYMPRARKAKGVIFVSQFFLELQGLIGADGEDPPRILHFNPRLKGDWSESPVIELNTCYRGQWGSGQRCDGWDSPKDEDKVDGLPKCESWVLEAAKGERESRNKRWLDRFVGSTKSSAAEWRYPFVEGQIFILTVRAGWEGYHISVDGRHVASFPYRTAFVLEEATGLSIKGDIDLDSVVVTALPLTHSSFSFEKTVELSEKLRSPPLPVKPVELFIGILSGSNHFAERMAARKSWMQSSLITSSKVVARLFVALHESNEVNAQVLKEATFYGDVVIVPFMDQYELVVLKTIAICEYGVQNISAKYIMKCDDDTFVRVENLLHEAKSTHCDHGLYMGNINLYHKPLRLGKWAVTYEEWPEEDYPPYANGPGYVITSDVADFIVSQHANHSLRLFKMEDVSMGMWVQQFNLSHSVKYQHNWKFCQFGCVEDYLTAHYQSPRQMLCLWEKLSQGKPACCNTR